MIKRKEVSSTVVAVFLVIAVIISVAGTYLVMDRLNGEFSSVTDEEKVIGASAQGNINLQIVGQEGQTSANTGQVSLTIVK